MKYSVLVTDDTPINRKLVKSVLKDMPDIEFLEAEDGVGCLEIMNDRPVDLLILDLMMPNKDGFEVLEALRESDIHRDIPVIVFSAMDSFDALARAFTLGACDYFTKPLTPQQMKVILPMKVRYHLESYENKRSIVKFNEQMSLEMLLARLFQQQLMKPFKSFDRALMYGCYMPCNQIGGDFYDCVSRANGDVCFLIADVAGHGVASAMLSSMIKVEFENCVRTMEKPSEMIGHMNQVFYPMSMGDYYFTAFLGIIRDGEMTFANAGHPYPILYSAQQGKASIVQQDGFAVGMFDEAFYRDVTMPFAAGDRLMTYTDGLVEERMTMVGNRYQTYEELAGFVSQYVHLLAGEPDNFFAIARKLFGNPENDEASDDIAVMIIEGK
ncbi:MAG: fused response regulator/phosphatase [Negativicutes bacterium]|nr:fused response regulator/phosphatase [Negativicutes bacterium]